MGRKRLRALRSAFRKFVSSERTRRALRLTKEGLPLASSLAVLVLTALAILIAQRSYLKTDIVLDITSPESGGIVLNKLVSIEGVVSGHPFSGYEVHHRGPGDSEAQLLLSYEEDSGQLTSSLFPILVHLTDGSGNTRVGMHAVTVTLTAGRRKVQQDSVLFEAVDCSHILPRSLSEDLPLPEPARLDPGDQIQGYDLRYEVDGRRWTREFLDPTLLSDGYHVLRVAAVASGTGKEADGFTTSFVVDNTAPRLDFLGTSEGATENPRTVLTPLLVEPHLAKLQLSVDGTLVAELDGPELQQRLSSGDLSFSLTGGWDWSTQPERQAANEPDSGSGNALFSDGAHDVRLCACDTNGHCTSSTARVIFDSVAPGLRWSAARQPEHEVLPIEKLQLCAGSPEAGTRILYRADPPAVILDGTILDLSQCPVGSTHRVRATAIDRANNSHSEETCFVIGEGPRAWLNSTFLSLAAGFSAMLEPVLDLGSHLEDEGLTFGMGMEVSSSLADESVLLLMGIVDFVLIEICPLLGSGPGSDPVYGLAFRVPIGAKESETSGLRDKQWNTLPSLGVGFSVAPNWDVLDGYAMGVEKVTETWIKPFLRTSLLLPLPGNQDAALEVTAGPGCKLTSVDEFVREFEYRDDSIVGIRELVRRSVKLEITLDFSIGVRRVH